MVCGAAVKEKPPAEPNAAKPECTCTLYVKSASKGTIHTWIQKNNISNTVTLLSNTTSTQVLLPTAKVKLVAGNGTEVHVKALLDSGAQISLATSEFLDILQLQTKTVESGVIGNKSNYLEHQIVHYRQRYNWDCGVSCVLMLLSAEQREEFLKNFDSVCAEEGFNQSTWTIDLCFLLKRFGIRHHMYTTMLGVNEDYRRHGYYDKILDLDRERVRRRFDEAPVAGIQVTQRSLTSEQLVRHLVEHGPILLLVDAGLLVCDLCKHNKLKAEFRRCFGGGYRGHYIALVGHSRGKLLYRDPALAPRLCAAAAPSLRRARLALGTDHDVILVFKDFR